MLLVRHVISERIEARKGLLPSLLEEPGLAPNIAGLRTAFRATDQLWMVMVEGVSGVWPSLSGPRLQTVRNLFDDSSAAEGQVIGDAALVPVICERRCEGMAGVSPQGMTSPRRCATKGPAGKRK
ncbi:MAG TPA: hypothetical protein VM120_27115 [Bryobacteraceae bacterium]|nr:hypothetical protein [Bryobacteraceae bacterium]